MKVRFGLQFFLAVALLLACAGSAFAQANAQLTGTVTDPSGAVVGKVAITLRDVGTNVTYTATSNDSGFYAIANLPPGTYELKASYAGFAPYTQTGIVLTVGESATTNVGLQLAREGEKVVVTTEVPVIEPTKTEISQVVGTQQVESLPTSNRVFTDFALLTPGVTTSRTSLGTVFTEFEVTQISFGGMRSFSNEIVVDGADFVNAASGIQRATPPQESVEEFRVVNNSFGADYGRAMGGIVNIVTKSGTNNFHGTAYEYLQNGAADARDPLQPAPLPHELRQNQFGIAAGGPIQKDKTFFFVNYEGKRSANSPDFAPDLVCFSGTLSSNCNSNGGNLTLIDLAKQRMGLAPEGCSQSLAICGSNLTPAQAFGYINGFLKTGDDDFGFLRIDRQLTTNNRLAVRYNVEDVRATGELVGQSLDDGGIAVPSAGRDLYTRDQSVVATVNSVLSPDVVNTVVAQYARRHYNFPGATGQPDLDLANDLQFGHNFGANDRLYETRAELSESVSWVKGSHIAKFGADGNWLTSLENFPGFTPVRLIIPAGLPCLYAFSEFDQNGAGWEGGNPVTDPLLGPALGCPVASNDNGVVVAYAGIPVPTDPSFQAGAPLVLASNGTNLNINTWANAYPQSLFNNYSKVIDHGYWGLYAQDQWRITPKLTFNYGLRWDVESGLSTYVTQDYRGFQPRIGLAYSPDSKTVIRAGFGMFDDRYNLTFFFVPNTQKTVPGYLCGNHAPANVATACADANILPQQLPMTNLGMATQGYQLAGFAGPTASAFGASVLKTGGYDQLNPVSLVGTCDLGLGGNECGIGTGGMDHNVSKIPYAEQASAEIDRQFGGGFALNVGYLYVGAHRLVRGNNINVPCPVGTTDAGQNPLLGGTATDPNPWPVVPIFPDWVPGLLNANGTFSKCSATDPANPGPGPGKPILGSGALAGLGPWFAGAGPFSGLQTLSAGLLDYNNGVANAVYHGLTVTGIERIGSYFNLTANYTYSHTIDNGNFTTFINLPVNQFDYAAERANSNQDQRHRFVTNFTATAPTHGWYRNFQTSSIITLQSGRPFTLYYGADTTNDFAGASTDRVGGPEVKDTHCDSASTCQTMIGRNTYVGDPEYTWDLRLSRVFKFSDKYSLVAAVDAFNLLNRANIDQVFSVYGSPVFCGAIPRHYNDGVTKAIHAGAASVACPAGQPGETPVLAPGDITVGQEAATPIPGDSLFIPNTPNANFGDPQTVLNPRQFQVSARFEF